MHHVAKPAGAPHCRGTSKGHWFLPSSSQLKALLAPCGQVARLLLHCSGGWVASSHLLGCWLPHYTALWAPQALQLHWAMVSCSALSLGQRQETKARGWGSLETPAAAAAARALRGTAVRGSLGTIQLISHQLDSHGRDKHPILLVEVHINSYLLSGKMVCLLIVRLFQSDSYPLSTETN